MCGSVMTRIVTTVSFRTTIVQGISDGPVDRLSILAESIASSLLAPRERRLVEKDFVFPVHSVKTEVLQAVHRCLTEDKCLFERSS